MYIQYVFSSQLSYILLLVLPLLTAKAVGRSTAWKCGLSDGHNGLADPLPRNIETLNYYIIYCCTNYTWSVHVYVYYIIIIIINRIAAVMISYVVPPTAEPKSN